MSYMNLVISPSRHKSFVAQWLEHPIGVQKVIGSIPVGDYINLIPQELNNSLKGTVSQQFSRLCLVTFLILTV